MSENFEFLKCRLPKRERKKEKRIWLLQLAFEVGPHQMGMDGGRFLDVHTAVYCTRALHAARPHPMLVGGSWITAPYLRGVSHSDSGGLAAG